MARLQAPLEATRAYVRGRTIRDVVLGAFLAVVLISGLFGGWDAAEREVAIANVAETIEAAPLEVTVLGAATSTDLDSSDFSDPEGRYIVVVADLTSDQVRSIPALETVHVARLHGVPGVFRPYASSDIPPERVAPRLAFARDGSMLRDIGPGLTYRTWLVWEQRPGAPEPSEVTVGIYGMTYRASSIDGSQGWFDPTLISEVTVPVTGTISGPDPTGDGWPAPGGRP
ncbi:MAG: hypothetical protein Q4G67_01005 [Actinomycetia bacterium]|nr:hypothetical protein [Actinomycetes bacterium]